MLGIELALPLVLPAAALAAPSFSSTPSPQEGLPFYGPGAARAAYAMPGDSGSYAASVQPRASVVNWVPSNVSQVTIPGPPAQPRPINRVRSGPVFSTGLLLGGRGLDSNAFDPLDDHFMIGFDFTATDFGAGPLGVEFGSQFSVDSIGLVDVSLAEIYLGGRLTLSDFYDVTQPIVPYVSAGGTLIGVDIDQGNFSSVDDTTGFYLSAGLEFRIAPELSIGVQYRHVGGADTDLGFAGLGGPGTELDYDQVALRMGFYF